MTVAAGTPPALGRVAHLATTGSTNDVVRGWLAAGEPEICVATADEQTAGRGRHGRAWTAPPGAALLCSLGFRPAWLPPERAWRLPATVALAMCDAAEEVAGLPLGAIRLKWPNDLVIETGGPKALLVGEPSAEAAAARLASPLGLRKLAGVLAESDGLGSRDPRLVVGIGINADWAAGDFPPDIASGMTSLREASAGRPIDRDALLAAFLERVELRAAALYEGVFDLAGWAERQATTGRQVTLDSGPVRGEVAGEGPSPRAVRALGVDAATGALVVEDPGAPGGERLVHAGEVTRVRVTAAGDAAADVAPAGSV